MLFVGSGLSLDSGAPTSQALADEMLAHFLDLPPNAYPLSEAAALIDAEDGRRRLNDWIVRRLRGLSPSRAIRALPSYRWKAIYTTNYDELIEVAYREERDRYQELRPIYSDRDQLADLRENEVPLYKLHGCITRANSEDGRLVITQDDLVQVEESRRRLFARLVDHVADLPILYLGFGRADPDFARVLSQVERAIGRLTDLPRSYALHPGFLDAESKRAELKKVTLIDRKAEPFLAEFDVQLPPERRRRPEHDVGGEPSSIRSSDLLLRRPQVPAATAAAVTEDFEILDDALATESDADAFFRGSPPTWGDIANGVDAPRDEQDPILEAVLVDPDLDRGADRFVLLHAEAGSGKTTLIRRLAVELATTWDRIVLCLREFGALDLAGIEELATQADERIYLIVDDALRLTSELRSFLSAARRAGTRVTIVAAARTNEWRDSADAALITANHEFELGELTDREIEVIIERLDTHGALGFLQDATPEARRDAFKSRAQKQLLVALREATEGSEFDEIVVDEYERIPTEEAKQAYLYIAALHRFGLFTRAPVLHRALQVPLAELGRRVFEPATKIIVAQELGRDAEPYYRTRHPLIAEIVFDRRVGTEAERLSFYLALIRQLDLGYASDADTYRRLSRSLNKSLLTDFQRVSNKRQLMAEIQAVDPTDAFVQQHAAMMELALGNLKEAATHIAMALEARPDDRTIRDTEGRIVLAGVDRETTVARKLAKLKEAESIFSGNVARAPSEPYGYRHLAETYWIRSTVEPDPTTQAVYIGKAYAVLVDGLDNAMNTTMLMQYRARLEQAEGRSDEALGVLEKALGERPDDVPMRVMAARIAERRDDTVTAIRILRDGVAAVPDAWELHYRLALLLATEDGHDPSEVTRHFAAAMLAPSRRYRPRLTHAAWLFSQRKYAEADEQFARLARVEIPAAERFEPRNFRFPRLRGRHSGRVTRLSADNGHVEYDGGATRIFFRCRDLTSAAALRVGSELGYTVRFNVMGPVAKNLSIEAL
ncbi:MAG: hypothetical protein QOD71_3501 [Thermoleophilaceae bacterium]|nr:hypothetical protein [Thermoleophilaceae bacterium]